MYSLFSLMFGQLDKVYREYQMEDSLDWLNRHHWS